MFFKNHSVSNDFVLNFMSFVPESECKGRDFLRNRQGFEQVFLKEISKFLLTT